MTKQPNNIKILACLDSDEMAASRRRELNILRKTAASLGRSAVDAASKGYYRTSAGIKVDWGDFVQAACASKRSICPDDPLPAYEAPSYPETRIQVANETTLGASRRFVTGSRSMGLWRFRE